MILTLITLLIVFLILKALTDLGYITHDSKLWHIADAATRTILFFYPCINYLGYTNKAYSIAILFLTIFWIGFDMLINIVRQMPLMYVGSGTIDLSIKKLATILKIHDDYLMLIFKISILILSILYIIYSW